MKLMQRHALVSSPPTDCAQFAFLVSEFVSSFYPGTESTYGLRLFKEHLADLRKGTAARRRVWAIRDGRESVGFLVATRRLDGSVKVGPIVVEPGHRSEGHMLDAVEEIVTRYEAEQVPYLYATYPGSNVSIGCLADRAGWEIAGVVRGLYRDDEEILIYRKSSQESRVAPLLVRPPHSSSKRFVKKRGGSVLLRVDESDSAPGIELAGRSAALTVRSMNRVCFSRVTKGVASSLDADEAIRLVDGTTLVIWR